MNRHRLITSVTRKSNIEFDNACPISFDSAYEILYHQDSYQTKEAVIWSQNVCSAVTVLAFKVCCYYKEPDLQVNTGEKKSMTHRIIGVS